MKAPHIDPLGNAMARLGHAVVDHAPPLVNGVYDLQMAVTVPGYLGGVAVELAILQKCPRCHGMWLGGKVHAPRWQAGRMVDCVGNEVTT